MNYYNFVAGVFIRYASWFHCVDACVRLCLNSADS